MKLCTSDTRATGYKVTEQILNICIDMLIRSKEPTKYSRVNSVERL